MNALVVERPGLLTTVQDAGRWGWQHLGVPVSGWMDPWSARLANRLAGNADDAALLEVTWLGPTVRIEGASTLAVTGASFDVLVDGVRHRSPFVRDIEAGATVAFGARHRGTRAYLAVSGGVATAPVLGSRATDVRSRLGGVSGRRLVAGDRVELGVPTHHHQTAPDLAAARWLHDAVLRVVFASNADPEATHLLCSQTFRVLDASDRTGYRLEGACLLPSAEGTLVSEPVVMGAVQLPPGGAPVLLMADRQTTGGYAVLGVVSAADVPIAGQLGPGDQCQFVQCSPGESREAIARREAALNAMAGRVA
jgi:biotin-dependent carboxylase-like uncharacterized protein